MRSKRTYLFGPTVHNAAQRPPIPSLLDWSDHDDVQDPSQLVLDEQQIPPIPVEQQQDRPQPKDAAQLNDVHQPPELQLPLPPV